MNDAWPRILLDPVQRQLDPDPTGRRFFIGLIKAACVSIGAAILLVIAIWAVLS